MSKTNIYFFIYFFFIIYIISSLNVFAFPFYNVQSAELSNGQKLIVHKFGIDIVDKDYNQIIRNEINFTNEEQISTPDELKNVIIKKFENGYIISLINNTTYIFDNLGNFLSKRENIYIGHTTNYYSLNIKDNYHFFIGFISDNGFYLYYYEFKAAIKEIHYLSWVEEIKIIKQSFLSSSYYSYKDIGINCHIMNDGVNGDTIACIFLLYDNDNNYYWYIKFFNLNENNQIIEDTKYNSIKSEDNNLLSYFSYLKAEVNSDKNILLICSYLTIDGDLCLFLI